MPEGVGEQCTRNGPGASVDTGVFLSAGGGTQGPEAAPDQGDVAPRPQGGEEGFADCSRTVFQILLCR